MVDFGTEELTAMFTEMEPEAQAPEVYRNTPFEHFSTADTGQLLVICSAPMANGRSWVAQAGTVRVRPALPEWMAFRLNLARPSAQPVGPFELTFEPLGT